jgi:hypothetical protein
MFGGNARMWNRALLGLILVAFTGLVAGGALVHAESCEVGVHCVVCKWARNAVPGLAVALTIALALLATGRAPEWQPLAIPWVPRRQSRSRGPPLS